MQHSISIQNPLSYRYAINRSQYAVAYAFSTIKDFNDNAQIKHALCLVHTTSERLKLIEKIAHYRNLQRNKEEMDQINRLRPILNRVRDKFFQLVRMSRQKTYGEDVRDFEKFGMRQSQSLSSSKKLNFMSLLELSKITKEEKVDFNDELDKEYCHHRNNTRNMTVIKLGHSGTRNLSQRSLMDNFSHFMKKRQDDIEPGSPSSPVKSVSFQAFKQLHEKSNRLNLKPIERTQLPFLTKASDLGSMNNIPIPNQQCTTDQSMTLVTQKSFNMAQSPTNQRKTFHFSKNAISKVHSFRQSPKNELMMLFDQQKKKMLKPSALFQYFKSKNYREDPEMLF